MWQLKGRDRRDTFLEVTLGKVVTPDEVFVISSLGKANTDSFCPGVALQVTVLGLTGPSLAFSSCFSGSVNDFRSILAVFTMIVPINTHIASCTISLCHPKDCSLFFMEERMSVLLFVKPAHRTFIETQILAIIYCLVE